MYTDAEIIALAGLKGGVANDVAWAFGNEDFLAFARALLAGEKAPTEKYNVKGLMELTDASQADGWGNGPTWDYYWRSVIKGRARMGSFRDNRLSGTSGPLVLDASGLNGMYGYIIAANNLKVHSRHAVEPKFHPVLRVDGVEYPCVADTWISSSTAKSTGLTLTLSAMGNTSLILLRFDAPVGEQVEIILHPTKALAAQLFIVHELIPPIDFDPDRMRDLYMDEDAYFRSQSIGGGEGLYEKNLNYQLQNPSIWKRAAWLTDGDQQFVRGFWEPTRRSITFKVPIFNETAAEGRKVAFQYDVRLAPNFVRACREGGKFAGFCSSGEPQSIWPPRAMWPGEPKGRRGEIYAGNGASVVHGDDGWSARGGYHPGIRTPGHPGFGMVPLHTYTYYLRQGNTLWHEALARWEAINNLRGKGYTVTPAQLASTLQAGETLNSGVSKTGDVMEWSNYPALLVPGAWHTVTQVMQINTPGVADGWLDAYIDGKLCGTLRDIAWRGPGPYWTGTLGIGAVWFNLYHGGTLMPLEEAWIDLKRLVVKVLEWDN
jgi:hypothetical protein